MASYAEVLWTEQEYGTAEAAYYRLQEARRYFGEDSDRYRRPMATHVYRAAIELYDRHIYEKGACVYHMLRAELGEDLFWQAIQTFVQNNAHRTVETIDLLRAIESATGRNLAFLFDQYVYRGGYPHYKVAYQWDGAAKLAKLTVTQTQMDSKDPDRDRFDLTLPIAFHHVQRKRVSVLHELTIRIHEQEQTFYIPLSEKPSFISFDVGNHCLKQVTLEYPLPELKAQLYSAPDPLARIDAAIAIAKKSNLEALKALAQALQDESFWGVRVEIVRQLATIKLDQAFDVLCVSLKDANARVRHAAVEALATFKTSNSYKALKTILDKSDPSYAVEAAILNALGKIAASALHDKPKEDKVIKVFKAALKSGSSWNETVRSGAITGLSHLKSSPAALAILLDYTILGIPQPLRLAAIRALGAIAVGQPESQATQILERLAILADESFFLTQVSVVIALGQTEHPKAIGILRQLAQRTPDGRVQRLAEEAIQNLQGKIQSEQAISTIQSELEELRKTNQDLKSRLEALEAKNKHSKPGGK